MMFRDKSTSKFYAFALAATFALILAGCGGGGGGGGSAMMCPEGLVGTPPNCTRERTPQQMCEDDGGRWNADMTCTTTEMLKIAADTKAAGTKEKAIAEEGMLPVEDDDGPGGADADPDDHTVTVKHDGTSAAVTIAVVGAAADDPKFVDQMAGLDAGRSMHVRTMEADADGNVMREIMIVSTDIDAPKDIPFAGEGGRYTLDANENEVTPAVNQSLNFDSANHDGLATLKDSKVNVPAPDGSVTLVGEDDTDTEDVKENEYEGTFDGAPGTFTCTTNGGCAVTVEDGEITNMAGVHFTPAEKATVLEPDGDYLYYGFWLKNTTDKDGAVTYNEVETFAYSSLAEANLYDVTSTGATYKGDAVGVYVRNVYNPDRTVKLATSGHFKADVSLTAYFGESPDVAPNKHHTIEGIIDNFTLQHGEDASGWRVNVEADFNGPDLADGTAKGGGAGDGSIIGTFHGDDTGDHDNDPATADVPIEPKVLVGEFNAEFTNGSVAGGFGARKQ